MKKLDVKRALPCLVTVGLFCCATPSFAGTWYITYTDSGTHAVAGEFSVPWRENDAVQSQGDDVFAGVGDITPDVNQSNQVSLNGQATPVCIWQDNTGAPPPPGKVTFLVESFAGANWHTDLASGTASLSVGNSNNPTALDGWTKAVKRRKLFQVDTSAAVLDANGQYCITLPSCPLNASLTLVNNSTQRTEGDIFVYCNTQLDNRTVTLSRVGAPLLLKRCGTPRHIPTLTILTLLRREMSGFLRMELVMDIR